MDLHSITGLLVPEVCGACRGPCDSPKSLCADCLAASEELAPIRGTPPPGIDAIASATAHHGLGRDLLSAYKFAGLSALAPLMADRMVAVMPGAGTDAADRVPMAVVPVPAAALRARLRGFDAADELARLIAARTDRPLVNDAIARKGLGRQRGRARSRRLGNPPTIVSRDRSPREVLLVDDVMTTGATLAACARTLRKNGAAAVTAVTFTRRL